MVPLTVQIYGVHFFKEEFLPKNWTKRVLLRYSTPPLFHSKCLLIKLQISKGRPYPITTNATQQRYRETVACNASNNTCSRIE